VPEPWIARDDFESEFAFSAVQQLIAAAATTTAKTPILMIPSG
jgi:hypothetical protein